jgi:3-dehydroquinate dehydratase-2
MKILVVNGPNLNMLGIREPDTYGKMTLKDIYTLMEKRAKEYNFEIEFFQSNHEGTIVDRIQESYKKVDYIVINPGAFTHYSIAIRDALLSVGIKTIEVHLSNIHSREEFRKKSVISDIALGQIIGFGYHGYLLAIEFIQRKEEEE